MLATLGLCEQAGAGPASVGEGGGHVLVLQHLQQALHQLEWKSVQR